MKNLIFNKELFDKGNYSELFKSVVESLSKSGVIASPEASMEVYKGIWLEGYEAGLGKDLPIHEIKTFHDLKSEL